MVCPTKSAWSLDENHNLHALTTKGELFVLAKDDWQAPEARPEASWKPVMTSDNPPRLLASIRTADDSSLSATLRNDPGHSQVHLKHDKWQPLIARPADHSALNDLFANIRGGEKSARIPFTGGAVRVAANLMGRTAESGHKSSVSEFFRAHVYKNTLEVPRPLKNIGNNIQHHHHGREGLRSIYDAESKLFERLDMIHKGSGKAPEAGNDFKSRIARLALGAPGAGLLKDLEVFRTELEDNSQRATTHLGHQHGHVLGKRLLGDQRARQVQLATRPRPLGAETAKVAHDLRHLRVGERIAEGGHHATEGTRRAALVHHREPVRVGLARREAAVGEIGQRLLEGDHGLRGAAPVGAVAARAGLQIDCFAGWLVRRLRCDRRTRHCYRGRGARRNEG